MLWSAESGSVPCGSGQEAGRRGEGAPRQTRTGEGSAASAVVKRTGSYEEMHWPFSWFFFFFCGLKILVKVHLMSQKLLSSGSFDKPMKQCLMRDFHPSDRKRSVTKSWRSRRNFWNKEPCMWRRPRTCSALQTFQRKWRKRRRRGAVEEDVWVLVLMSAASDVEMKAARRMRFLLYLPA